MNTIRYFATFSVHIGFGTIQAIGNGKVSTLADSLESIVNLYCTRGFQVTLALADNQFCCLEDKIKMPVGCLLNTVSADEHVGIIKRYIRTVKERSRNTYSALPFKWLPRMLTTGIVVSRIFGLNVFPRKGGISKTYGPRAILLGTVIDYARHCQLETEQYVEVHEKTDNTMKWRSEPALYLYPSGNAQGGGYYMKISNREHVHRNRFTVIPMPENVVEQVHQLAKRQ